MYKRQTYGFRVAAIAEYQVLHAGTVGCELQYHHAVGVGNEVFTLCLLYTSFSIIGRTHSHCIFEYSAEIA